MGKKDEQHAQHGEEGARDFGVFLGNIDERRFLTECGVELRDLVRSMRLHAERNKRAKGKLTITLSLIYEDGRIVVSPDVKQTKPPRDRGVTWMFATEGDNISPEMERQTSFAAVRAVPTPETKQVPVPAAAEKKSV